MNSADIKTAFAAHGIKVRVRDLGQKFRVCTVDGSAHTPTAQQVAKALQLTDALGQLGGQILQAHELIAYKPGIIR